MPKAKPDEVIVHRIELQQSERDMLETAIGVLSERFPEMTLDPERPPQILRRLGVGVLGRHWSAGGATGGLTVVRVSCQGSGLCCLR